MKKLTKEQIEQMSYTDVAHLVLKGNGKKMKIQDLFKEVIKLMELPESYFENKIGDFFGLLSTDKRFVMIEKGFWDLRINHSSKIEFEEDEEDEEESILDEEIDGEDEEEVNYDDEDLTDDDEDEDALKDLVIMDESEEETDLI